MRAQALVVRNLRRLRVERSLSQEALAADAGIDRTYVSRLERGLENPTVAVLEQIADALSATIVEFFVVPAPDEPPPKPLRGGRRPKR
jgi:transcriptional regulator with XRE-family HTH domain